MTEVDYEAIEAAVTETVRGRWFLNEFARRNRGAEVKVLLDAMARLETQVTTSLAGAMPAQPALSGPAPSADPSIRLLVQRIKEIAGQLDHIGRAMREHGVDDLLCEAVDLQARAVAGLMRTGPGPSPVARPAAAAGASGSVPPAGQGHVVPAVVATLAAPEPVGPPALEPLLPPALEPLLPPGLEPLPSPALEPLPSPAIGAGPAHDPRLAALSGLDRLPLAKKLAFFA